jgi:phage recombination protein Bet
MSENNLPALVGQRGISIEVWSALKNSLYPGAADESVLMAWDYCSARKLDVMLKPVHLVPMWIKDKQNGDKGAMRDVVMPGIGLYRIQADRAGNYAGMSAPVFGPDITQDLGGQNITFPEWCEITVSKLMGDRLVTFTAREYWVENYATAGKDSIAPNSMWKKRPRAQLVKCTEAQALRKGWPELGAQPTYEEMEGKEIEINPTPAKKDTTTKPAITIYSEESFATNFPAWEKLILSGKKSANDIISMVSSKAQLSEDQTNKIYAIQKPLNGELVDEA